MSKVWRQTFAAGVEDRERDERYARLMQARAGLGWSAAPGCLCCSPMHSWPACLNPPMRPPPPQQALGFVDLPTLMGVDVLPDESLLALAQVCGGGGAGAAWPPATLLLLPFGMQGPMPAGPVYTVQYTAASRWPTPAPLPHAPSPQAEVLKMDRYKAPRDKLLCLVNVKTMVEGVVAAAARAGANVGGACSSRGGGGRGVQQECAAPAAASRCRPYRPTMCYPPTHPPTARRRRLLPRLPVCGRALAPAAPGVQRGVCEAVPRPPPPQRPVRLHAVQPCEAVEWRGDGAGRRRQGAGQAGTCAAGPTCRTRPSSRPHLHCPLTHPPHRSRPPCT